MGDVGADDATDYDVDDGGVVFSLPPNVHMNIELCIRLRCRNASGDFTL